MASLHSPLNKKYHITLHPFLLTFGRIKKSSMKRSLKVIAGIVIVLALIVAGVELSGNGYLRKGLWACYLHGNNSATIDDARFFDTHKVAVGDHAGPWPVRSDYNKAPLPAKL